MLVFVDGFWGWLVVSFIVSAILSGVYRMGKTSGSGTFRYYSTGKSAEVVDVSRAEK